MSAKQRIDILLVEKGLESSRERAKALIMSGLVFADQQKIDKPGQEIDPNAKIEIRGHSLKYVSRGGLKLEKAIEVFHLDLNQKVCMDIGASTGGFTDCMLQSGANRVYAVDVGYGQLAWKLRTDPRVINLERTNIRYITAEQLAEQIDFFSVDVSFISLKLVLPVAMKFLKPDGEGVCLIKPQFEAGRGNVGKKGVVRDPAVHREVIARITEFAQEIGFSICGLDYSPVKGPEGNIEYLLYVRQKQACQNHGCDFKIENVVARSHQQLDGGVSI